MEHRAKARAGPTAHQESGYAEIEPPMAFRTPQRNVMMWLLLAFLFGPGLAAIDGQQTAPGSTMLEAARSFLATLDPAQKSQAVLPFNSEERFRWFYTPVSRKGIPLKELNASQREAALSLLRAGLSERG